VPVNASSVLDWLPDAMREEGLVRGLRATGGLEIERNRVEAIK